MLALAAGLLKASGPSPTPQSFGSVLGSGGMMGLNAYSTAKNEDIKNKQTQTLIGLEQEKMRLTQAQVNAAMRQQALQEWALTGNMPTFMQAGAPTQAAVPGDAYMPAAGAVNLMPASMQTPGGFNLPAVPPGSPLSGLSPEAQQAVRLNMAIPGSGNIAWQSTQPVVGREGGIYRRNPQTGALELDPGWIKGEEARLNLQKGIENQNTVVDVPLADGRSQRMTKAQELKLTSATAELANALPNLDKTAIASIQRQLLAEPDKPVDVNITLGGRQAKLTLQPLSGAGFTAGQSTAAKAAQETSGKNAGNVQSQIDEEAASALQSRKILGEMRALATDFTPSKVAPFKRALGEWAQALNLPGNWQEEIKAAESQQALQKLTAQMATAAMKSFTSRGTQMEFKTFLQNNPNAELTAGGFQKVLEFMDKTAQTTLDKQQAYQEWRKANPIEKSQDFLAEWNKKQNAELAAPAQPRGQTFADKPPAKDYRGKTIRDTQTGKLYRSDGMIWKEVQ